MSKPPSRERRQPSAPPEPKEGSEPIPFALRFTLALCLGLWILATLVPSNWVWGLDVAAYLPRLPTAALLVVALAGLLPLVSEWILGGLAAAARAWRAHPGRTEVLAAALVGLCAFAFTDPLRFLGDSALRWGALQVGLPADRLYPQAFPLDRWINGNGVHALVALGFDLEISLRLVGSAMAALFAGVGLAFLRATGGKGPALPAAALALLGGSYLLVFPGYDKFGPLLVGVALTALGVVQLARARSGAWLLALGATMSVLSHRTGYLLLPAALLALVAAVRTTDSRQARTHLLAAGGVILLVAGLLLPRTLALFFGLDAALQGNSFLSALAPGAPGGGLLVHLSDAVNTLFFLVPLWPIGVAAGWVLARSHPSQPASAISPPLGRVALLAVLPALLLLFVTRGPQGAARDWEIYAGAGVTIALVVAALVARCGARLPTSRLWSGVATLALALAAGHWAAWAHEPSQLRRIEGLLRAKPAWNAEQRARAYDFLGSWAFRSGRFSEAASYMHDASQAAPNPRYFYQAGLAHWRAGELDAARQQALRAIEGAPDNAYPWWILSVVARASGEYAAAAAYEDSARARGATSRPEGL